MDKETDPYGQRNGAPLARENLASKLFRVALRWNYPLERREIFGFLYFFLIITSYYIIKPLRTSRFLTDLGAENIPYFYLLNSFLVFAIVYAYNHVVDFFNGKKRLLFLVVNSFLAFNILGFAFLFSASKTTNSALPTFASGKGLTIAFFIWASFFGVFVVSVFWSLMSELFTSEEGKRSYAFIGLGGVLGGAFGGKLAEVLAKSIGESWLLVLSAAILGVCALLTGSLVSDDAPVNDQTAGNVKGNCPVGQLPKKEKTQPSDPCTTRTGFTRWSKWRNRLQGLSLILGDSYVGAIAAIVMFMTMAGTLFDYQLNTICQMEIHQKYGFGDLLRTTAERHGGALGSLTIQDIERLRRDREFDNIDRDIRSSIKVALDLAAKAGIPNRAKVDSVVLAVFCESWTANVGKFAGSGFNEFDALIKADLKNGLKSVTTAFFGWVYGTVSLVSFLIQLFLSARIQQTFGIPASLSVLPAVCVPGLVILLAAPLLAVISCLTIIQNGLSYSLMQSTREQLYIPVSDEVRYKAKPIVDTFIFRLGDALASLAILIGTGVGGLGIAGLTVVNSFFVILWAASVRFCGARYAERVSLTNQPVNEARVIQ